MICSLVPMQSITVATRIVSEFIAAFVALENVATKAGVVGGGIIIHAPLMQMS